MSKYIKYEVEDFAADDAFMKWCIDADDDSETYWSEVLNIFPQKAKTIYEAKLLVKDLHHIQQQQAITKYSSEIWNEVRANISFNESETKKSLTIRRLPMYKYAAILLVLIFSVAAFYFIVENQSNFNGDVVWTNLQNNTSEAQTYTLSDQSSITLEPFSTLKFPKTFDQNQRIVFLTGEAFFDVSRDTLRPFIVYANETITKVLGTSFRISAYEGQKTVQVDVTSGKVAVFANVKNDKGISEKPLYIYTDMRISIPKPNKKIELTPNQAAVFNMVKSELIKTVSDSPRILAQKSKELPFEFYNETITKVFDALGRAYGLEIQYNFEELKSCTITTKLDDEPLLEKLDILCSALNLRYYEDNAKIIIEGGTCK